MKPKRTATAHSLLWLSITTAVMLSGVTAVRAGYPELILSNNPAAYYRLEEVADTTAYDSSPNHFDATYVTSGAFPQLGDPGIATNSVQFQSSNPEGFISIPYHPELNPLMPDGQHGAAFSVECWVQPTVQSTDPNGYTVPLAMFGTYSDPPPFNNASGWNIYQEPNVTGLNRWTFNLKTVGFFSSTTKIELLKWYHLVFTFDGAAGYFYVNGVAEASAGGITGYYANPSHDGQIGAGDNVGFGPFTGNLDEVAFYTNALSAADVLAHYQLGTNSFRELPTPPTVVQQPVSQSVYHGTTATFSAVAGGTPPLHYQWYRGAAPISGATNNSYSFLAQFPADNNASFYLNITNSISSTNTDTVTLTVLTDLNITNPYGPITRNVGSKAAFRVVASGALPITYQWFKGSTALVGQANDTLWLNNVQSGDAALYHAQVTGPFTSTNTADAELIVQARPVTVPLIGYAKIIAADDPVAYWRLDEADGSATAVDAVGSFDGSYTPGGGAVSSTNGIPVDTNAAVRIQGGGVVSIPYALELNPVTGPWSFEAWVRPAVQPGDFATPFAAMNVVPGHIYGWNIYQHAASAWTLATYNGGTGPSGFTSDLFDLPLVLNSWYHLVISDDLTTLRLIVNGVERTSVDRNSSFAPNGSNGDPATGAALILGQRNDLQFLPFDGSIDEVAVYNKALTVAQARLHYLASTELSISQSNGNLYITWPVGTLQSSTSATGPYANVIGATSPYLVPTGGTQTYYRVQTMP